jgi:hypothetical protein
MNDKPTGEWTAERITRVAENNPTLWAEKVAEELNKLNAALAAERERSKELSEDCEHFAEVIEKREQQLAAEERRASDSIEENVRLMNRLAAEREKQVAGWQAWHEVKQLREQLAAEREALKQADQYARDLLEERDTLVDALTGIANSEAEYAATYKAKANAALAKVSVEVNKQKDKPK